MTPFHLRPTSSIAIWNRGQCRLSASGKRSCQNGSSAGTAEAPPWHTSAIARTSKPSAHSDAFQSASGRQ